MTDHDDMPTISLAHLAWINAKIGVLSFGGGITALMYHQFVTRLRIITEQDFLSALTIAQVIPGPNVVNLSIYIGQKLHGYIGAIVAVVAFLAGPFLLVIGLYLIYDRLAAQPWAASGLEGVMAAAIGMLGMVVLRGVVASKNLASHCVVLATFVLVGVLRLPLIPVVLCVAPVSIALAARGVRRDG